ncbi:cyclin-dependent kinase inhibitor 1-like [Oppia nitens]|uniref:cyclin-dependent kinase inhibitor 1-like n=1 Tax=Oppia nitens TaxID=1686743 RepID=UPI0023DC203B|nr:cyclin-dependent kinase inhibitor 1-like [Oppia nitens]XP_054159292.1 cyclin-dependent kinase inhibitor 1-like [Oppia nitens]
MSQQVLDMSVGNIAQNVWSVSGRTAPVDWDQQHQQQDYVTNQQPNQSSYHMTNHLVSSRSRVQRSLFGPTDPQENHRMAYEETNCRRYVDRNRWNFDFYSEKPTSGRFEWKRVAFSDDRTSNFGPTGEQSDHLWSKKKSAKS